MNIKSKDPSVDILKARPTLKPASVKSYVSQLERLQKLFNEKDFDFLGDPDKVIKGIQGMEKGRDKLQVNYLTHRNALNAIIVLLMALNSDSRYDNILKTYVTMRDKFNEQYVEESSSGVVSDKQKPNFATSDEIFEMLEKMETDLKDVDFKKELPKKTKQLLQAYTLFAIYSLQPPMRNDVAGGMEAINKGAFNKLSDDEKNNNNYLVVSRGKLSFVLSDYKTNKKYGTIVNEVENERLQRILKHYIKVNGMGVLFKTSSEKPITRIELSKILLKYSERYMDKKISTTLLRKAYLSTKHGQDGGLKDQLAELEKDAKAMAHSSQTALNTYIKKKE